MQWALAGFVALAISSSPAAAESRVILAPFFAPNDPSSLYLEQFTLAPPNQFYLKARFQRSWTGGSPLAEQTTFNAFAFTGLGPLPARNQRGPSGGEVEQSVYQIAGNEVGILMRTQDGPHPCQGVPPASCKGFHKHTVFERTWSPREMIFTSNGAANSVDVEADINVNKFAQWNSRTGGASVGIVAGQLVFVIFLEDGSGNRVQYVIYAYDSNPTTYNGDEVEPQLEPIGAGNNGYYLTSSFKKRRVMKYTTVDRSSAELAHKPWASYRHFKIRITQENLRNAIAALNARGGKLSTDVMDYGITLVGVNQEIAYRMKNDKSVQRYDDNGDEAVMGSSVRNIKVSETFRPVQRKP